MPIGSPIRYLVLACMLAASAAVFAHAILVDSTPAANATISGPKLAISLRFNVRIDAARSHLQLLLPNGKMKSLPVRAGDTANVMLAGVTDLTPGTYTLIWQVLATDGHITRGEIRFSAK
jgi:methionine-rich copper-binding protein CopC